MNSGSLGRFVYVVTGIAAVAFITGLVVAAAAGIAPSINQQNANENIVNTSTISWLSFGLPSLKLVPSPAPAAASSSAKAPSTVANGSAFGLGTVAAGAEAESLVLTFTSAPASTEVEWQVWVNGTSVTSVTVFLTTPATAFSGTVTFFYQLAVAGGSFTLNQVTSVVQQCASTGNCP